MEIKTTNEIMKYYHNYCLLGTTSLEELDEYVDKKWIAVDEVKKQYLSKDYAEKLRISSIHRYALDMIKLIDELKKKIRKLDCWCIDCINKEINELKSKIEDDRK